MFFKNNPRYIFLVDGFGAILSAALLALVLPLFLNLLGMPLETLYILSILPVVYSIYSLLCYFSDPFQWKFYLRVIAIANFLYCLVTMVYLILNLEQTTIFGELYFVLEMIVVAGLATFELKISN
ncbi:hypothetical protein LEP1GSC199_1331 [Leptospira vanthielii serovar Holland str. Waz Holland = ATCC 700522]|uniref:Uncharacterized protein n=2 Tax=Leptospira vanthielii TaxID=293085 RepID=N1WEB0_9LEPT|nr:hypothetical protein LEP1GSC199_1331 [Leptospira vanthielii serovar Holland str. Waz Holland = ATCC 700522]